MYSGGAAQSAPALNGSIKKASVPASHALHKDGGLKLPAAETLSAYSRTL